ncbi:Plancitoxin-1 [Trichinella murrelli]|uniref:Plancitoxin-1 n=1 Tax=Trichinella murrelli TaxID=144512 RepID=A0A0V0TVJ4_9BILA|nr:Plancitoxin-1 [Trichinella murrelli]
MMFTSIIVIFISLKICIAQVATCKDDNNANPPNVLSSKLLKSAMNPAWAASGANIDQNRDHSIIRTMASFVQFQGEINVLAYSDDPPNLPPRNEKSKTKGVLLIDNRDTDAAAWFVHTVPKFLAHLGGYSWPAAETAKGHMFLCLAFNEAHLNLVAKAIRYQEPFIYANSLSPELLNQHVELSNLITGTQIRVTPFLEHAKFATKAAANIQAFGKHTKSYSVLKNKFAANIRIWAPSDARSKSICKGQYQLRKIASPMQLAGSLVSREADSAKWALIEGKNTVCFTTNDYKMNEKRIPGAAVCLENAGVYTAFTAAAFNVEVLLHRFQLASMTQASEYGHLQIQDRNRFVIDNINFEKLFLQCSWLVVKFLVYKPPTLLSTKIIKSERNPTWGNSAANIDQNARHSIAETMASFIANNREISVLAYSDDPPNLPPMNEKSKAKVHNGATDAAAWFVHTAPNFLAHLGPYLWPAAETPKGHMFLCLSLNEAQLDSVAKAIRYQEPFIYANNLPAALLNLHNELSNLAKGVQIRVTPFLEHAKFTTKSANGAAANIDAFGKHTKSFADMYARVLKNKFASNIRIWAPSDARSKSICKGQYQLRKIASPMQLAGSLVSREADSAKWALIEGKNTVCFTTNDYKMNEKRIPGAAVCLENAGVYTAFTAAAFNVEAIRYQEPYIYANNLPPAILNQYMELSNLVNGVDVRITPFLMHAKFTTKAAHAVANIQAFGKHSKSFAGFFNSGATIDNDAGHSIRRTMADFVANNGNINVLAYSDDPPNLPPMNEKSKTKGALLVHNGAAAWFVHTAPNFLAHLGPYLWPAAETPKGHMFLCLSFNVAQLNSVAKAIRYQEPFIYANNLSPALLNLHNELSNLAKGVQIRVTPFLEHTKFTTKSANGAAANIDAFGKHTKSFADMYARVLKNKFAANIRIWAPSDTRSKSICKGQYQLRKIASPMQFAGSQVSREADSARWALIEGKNTVCFTTNDYKMNEKRIPGAAVCLENAGVYTAFTAAAFIVEGCNK